MKVAIGRKMGEEMLLIRTIMCLLIEPHFSPSPSGEGRGEGSRVKITSCRFNSKRATNLLFVDSMRAIPV